MPFDTERIATKDAEQLINSASPIELYLLSKAYGVCADSYITLDRTVASYDMPQIVRNLNVALCDLGLQGTVPDCQTMRVLVESLRLILETEPKAHPLNWLIYHDKLADMGDEIANKSKAELDLICLEFAAKSSLDNQ